MSRISMLASTQHRETESAVNIPTHVADPSGFECQWAHQRLLLCHKQKFPAEDTEQQWPPGPRARRK